MAPRLSIPYKAKNKSQITKENEGEKCYSHLRAILIENCLVGICDLKEAVTGAE